MPGGETATRRLDPGPGDRVQAGALADAAPGGARAAAPGAASAPRPRRRPAQRGAFSRFVRLMLALVALVLIAAAVATAVIVSTDKATGVQATEVAGDTVDKVVEEFKDLLSKNTE